MLPDSFPARGWIHTSSARSSIRSATAETPVTALVREWAPSDRPPAPPDRRSSEQRYYHIISPKKCRFAFAAANPVGNAGTPVYQSGHVAWQLTMMIYRF